MAATDPQPSAMRSPSRSPHMRPISQSGVVSASTAAPGGASQPPQPPGNTAPLPAMPVQPPSANYSFAPHPDPSQPYYPALHPYHQSRSAQQPPQPPQPQHRPSSDHPPALVDKRSQSIRNMLGAESSWYPRLEKLAIVSLCLSILGSMGVPQGYNAVVAAMLLSVAYLRIPRLNAASGFALLVSFLTDIVFLSLHGSDWSSSGHEYAFGMATLIVNMIVKLGLMLAVYFIWTELGTAWQDHAGPVATGHGGSVSSGGSVGSNQYQGFGSNSAPISGSAPVQSGGAGGFQAGGSYQAAPGDPSHAV